MTPQNPENRKLIWAIAVVGRNLIKVRHKLDKNMAKPVTCYKGIIFCPALNTVLNTALNT